MDSYVPEQGDFVWINMNPQLEHEQAGRRPAIILSPVAYNKKVALAILCPITKQTKGYPFEVIIPIGLGVNGVILSDQVKSFDWKARNTVFIGKAPETTTLEVLKKLNTLLRIPFKKL
jgi:mRNA interferase MazF